MAHTTAQQAVRDRNDLWVAIGLAAVAVGFVVFDAVRRIAEIFSTPGATTVWAPIDAQSVELALGDGVEASVSIARLVIPDAPADGTGFVVASIILGALALLAAVVLAAIFCVNLLRGRVFTRTNVRLLLAGWIVLLVPTLYGVQLQAMGLDRLFAAIGAEFTALPPLFFAIVPQLVGAFVIALLGIPFRRGLRLQKETELLV